MTAEHEPNRSLELKDSWDGLWPATRGGLGSLKMKIGICIVPFGVTYLECREAAMVAEASGFESVWTWDHLLSFNDDDEPVLECWTLLAALAEATQRVKLGSFVANVLNRAPDVLAKTVATVQQISGGRIELGMGAGARPKEQVGISTGPSQQGGNAVERVGEAVELMRLMWTGERVSYQGKYYSAEGVISTPAPGARATGDGSGAGAEVGEERCESGGWVELRGASGGGRRGEPEVQAAKANRAGRAGETRAAQGPVRDFHLGQAG